MTEVEVARKPQITEPKAKILHGMIVNQAKELNREAESLRQMVDEYNYKLGWVAMGFDTLWDSFAKIRHELGFSQPYLAELCRQGKAVRQGAPEDVSGKALNQFAKLNDEPSVLRKAVEQARIESGGNPITEKLAKKVVSRYVSPVTEKREEKRRTVLLDAASAGRAVKKMEDGIVALKSHVVMGLPDEAMELLKRGMNLLNFWLRNLEDEGDSTEF